MMNKYYLILITTLLCWSGLIAQTTDAAEIVQQAVSDSVMLQREKEIVSEYGFKDTNTLEQVAEKLLIKDFSRWKSYLGLEPANKKLDSMSLLKLGIAPYRALLAQQYSVFNFTELSTLSEVAAATSMPIKKLKQMMGLADATSRKWDHNSLQALNFTPLQIEELHQEFNENSVAYGANVTLVGMLTVFLALLVTSMVISQLVHLNRPKKTKQADIVVDTKGKVKSTNATLDRNVIVAAIAALHIYQQSIEDRRRLVLTYRRTPTNQWRASAVTSMPNREMGSKRR
ncbi:MAG: OadG family protein [Candidatus Cloacimonetes bacterium]|nr:OadG family protein [Candidatus Cloacimonadota bacterium]